MTRHDVPRAEPGDGLRDELRAEAARHRPSREAMLRRIEQGQAAPGRVRTAGPRRTGLRVAGSAVAIAAVLGLSVAGTWAAVGQYAAPDRVGSSAPVSPPPQIGTAVGTPAPGQGPSAPGTRRTTASGTSAGPTASGAPSTAPSASVSSSATPLPSSTGATRIQQGFLWSDGSIDPHSTDGWAQSDITLKNRLTVTTLDVRLRVALTPGVADTGTWSTVPAADLVTTVTRDGIVLLYEFTLRPGATLAPGSYEFAGQYNHAPGGRDAGQDTYQATASAHSTQVEVFGNFYATH